MHIKYVACIWNTRAKNFYAIYRKNWSTVLRCNVFKNVPSSPCASVFYYMHNVDTQNAPEKWKRRRGKAIETNDRIEKAQGYAYVEMPIVPSGQWIIAPLTLGI